MAFLATEHGVLYYRLTGPVDAPPLVMVNSLGTDCRIWDDVIADLGARYRTLSYDLRGHGMSSTPAGDYDVAMHVADLTALLDHLRMDKVALCGVSIGGLIAQAMAAHAPQRLAALILCDTAAKIGTTDMWNDRIAVVQQSGIGAIADAVMERWFSPTFIADHPQALAIWRRQMMQSDPQGYAACCATLRDADLCDNLGRIDMPVLVVAGGADRATPPDLVAENAAQIPGAQFQLLEGVGHIPSIEAPQLLAKHITSFLEEAAYG